MHTIAETLKHVYFTVNLLPETQVYTFGICLLTTGQTIYFGEKETKTQLYLNRVLRRWRVSFDSDHHFTISREARVYFYSKEDEEWGIPMR